MIEKIQQSYLNLNALGNLAALTSLFPGGLNQTDDFGTTVSYKLEKALFERVIRSIRTHGCGHVTRELKI
jgi:hypothetical protein